MRITAELAQPIVERAIAILQRNINIMDEQGIIVGSGDPARIGTFHEGASLAIRTGAVQEIHPDEAARWEGARPGINLPIAVGGRIVGVIGITGPPWEVRPFGELLREMAQLMLLRAHAAEVERVAGQAREALLREVLVGTGPITEGMEREASLLDMPPDEHYVVLLCEPVGDWPCNMGSGEPAGGQGAPYQRLDALAQRLQATAVSAGAPRVVVAGPWAGRLVAVTARPPANLAGRVWEQLRAGGEEVALATGPLRRGLVGLRESYRTGLAALTAGRRLRGAGAFTPEELALETLLLSIDPEQAALFVAHTLGGLAPLDKPQGRVARQTIETYFEHGLSATRAAEALFIHRHTLVYRLAQIRSATGLDPASWDGGLRLYLALLLERLFGRKGQNIIT